MRRLLEREQHHSGYVLRVERNTRLVEISLFQRPIAAMALEDNIRPCKARKYLGDANCGLGKIGAEAVTERPDARFARCVGRRFRYEFSAR